MNTQGWMRGLIAFNSPLDKFVNFVSNTISKEFELKLKVIKENKSYIFCFDIYKIEVSVQELIFLQEKGPYALDKFILESLKTQGFKFNINKSQYIEYCYGIYQ